MVSPASADLDKLAQITASATASRLVKARLCDGISPEILLFMVVELLGRLGFRFIGVDNLDCAWAV